MTKAACNHSTTLPPDHPDYPVQSLIRRCADLWHETNIIDQRAVALHREGKKAAAKAAGAKGEAITLEVCALEHEVILDRVAQTAEGHRVKLKMACGGSFDLLHLVYFAWALGHEAGRLRLPAAIPDDLAAAAEAASG